MPAIPEILKQNVFMVIEEQLPLKEFEAWLYDQHDLSEMMNNDLILSLFLFNYNQRGVQREFKNTFLKYFDRQEFMLWKVKANLLDLIEGKGTRDRILSEFYQLGYDEYTFLQSIGYYMYYIEDIRYYKYNIDDVLKELKQEAFQLLQNIKEQENNIPGFKISEFIKPRENKINESVVKEEPLLTKKGCAAVCVAGITIFVSGCLSIISWLSDLF